MYICHNCGERFATPRLTAEELGECHGFPAYEQLDVCPNCGSVAEELGECASCGGDYAPQYLQDGLCAVCAEQLLSRLRVMLEEFFLSEEIEWLRLGAHISEEV
ncbi:MAG: hypothetical protein Q4B96_04295 [Bacillota bacterium]|nr:hypothetical protein [Bacillota bacterium]